jgi:hypothetical protein
MEQSRSTRAAAWDLARRQGWSPYIVRGDFASELMAIRDGAVYVCQTANQSAGISAAVDLVRNAAPYNLDGAGQTVGVWDGGSVRTTHQELTGRVLIRDASAWLNHATHVAGTVGAAGYQSSAMGMAPGVYIDSYNWTNDLAGMTLRAMAVPGESGKIQISNHSYVYAAGWDNSSGTYRWYGTWGELESFHFGQYEDSARQWDQLCYDAPYYLPVKAAGNDRDDPVPPVGGTFQYWLNDKWNSETYDPQTDPPADNWDDGGYDTLSTISTAKNPLVVGAVSDATYGGYRDPSSATMAVFSVWGPTDDGRIKPDIMATGVNLYSCTADGIAAYATYSGTSMAAPVVSGSAALLTEYHSTLFSGQYMRSSMLKGLMIHTADDLPPSGPDYKTGWGLLNVQAAAEQLRLHQRAPGTFRMVNGSLSAAQPTASQPYTWDGTHPIKVTICWTDPPGEVRTGLDNPALCLVNDLDLRVHAPDGTTIHLPFVLDPASPGTPATTGDNIRDNVEQVYIPAPVAGTYTVQVGHKGTLVGTEQPYALLVSGVAALIVGDYDRDEDVDLSDLMVWEACASGPGVAAAGGCEDKDLDHDGDVDQGDFSIQQHCYSGGNGTPAADCFE